MEGALVCAFPTFLLFKCRFPPSFIIWGLPNCAFLCSERGWKVFGKTKSGCALAHSRRGTAVPLRDFACFSFNPNRLNQRISISDLCYNWIKQFLLKHLISELIADGQSTFDPYIIFFHSICHLCYNWSFIW